MKTFLHIGCGPKRKDRTTRGFNTEEWQELRFDIDESVKPDLVGTMTDMSAVADASVDAVISNCVINLSIDKESVFSEIFRVLKHGGRVMISDLVLVKTLPEEVANSLAAYAGCVAGAIGKDDYIRLMKMAGFRDVRVVQEKGYDGMSGLEDVSDAVRSVSIFATKP